MAKDKTIYACTQCGGTSAKWLGKCPHCEAWNTLIEGVAESAQATKHRYHTHTQLAPSQALSVLSEIEAQDVERTPTGHEELDRVLGGGLVRGGVVLMGGDPGIGKSTLLLQAVDRLERDGVSSITVAELYYGVVKSREKEKNMLALNNFILDLEQVFFDEQAASIYGELRVALEKKGKIIGPLDMLIAAHAKSLGLVLITNNTKEFSRISGLLINNWFLD